MVASPEFMVQEALANRESEKQTSNTDKGGN